LSGRRTAATATATATADTCVTTATAGATTPRRRAAVATAATTTATTQTPTAAVATAATQANGKYSVVLSGFMVLSSEKSSFSYCCLDLLESRILAIASKLELLSSHNGKF